MADFETRIVISAQDQATANIRAVADSVMALAGQAESSSARFTKSLDGVKAAMAVLDKGDYGASLRQSLKENQYAVDGFAAHMDQAFARVSQQARVRLAGTEMSLRQLGVRPLQDITREIAAQGQAYQFAKDSGVASPGELALARQNMEKRVAALNREAANVRSGYQPSAVVSQPSAMSGLMGASLMGVGGVVGAAYAVSEVAGKAKEIAVLAARYDTLGVAMHTVGENAGYSSAQTDAAARSLQKTGISAIESRESISRLVVANLDLGKASQLARLAQDAAVVGGVNSSEAYATLVEGIQSARVETLRTIGINVSFEESYRKMAVRLGTTAEALTETQKMQARFNTVLEYAPRLAGTYEAAMGTVGKQLLSLERYTEDFKVALGEIFQPALTDHVQRTSDLFKEWTEHLKDPSVKANLTDIVGILAKMAEYAVKIAAIPVAAPAAMARDWGLAEQIRDAQDLGLIASEPAPQPQSSQPRPALNPDSFLSGEEGDGGRESRPPLNPDSFVIEGEDAAPPPPSSRRADAEFLRLSPQEKQQYFNSPAFKRKVEEKRKEWLQKYWGSAVATQEEGPAPLNTYQYANYEAELVHKGTLDADDLGSFSDQDQRMILDDYRKQDWDKAHSKGPDPEKERQKLKEAQEYKAKVARDEYLSNYLHQNVQYSAEDVQLEKATSVWTGERQQIQGHWLDASRVGDVDSMRQAEEALARSDLKLVETRKQINKSFEESALRAKAYLHSLQDENATLTSQFSGDTLATALAKNAREYDKAMADVEEKKRAARPGSDVSDYTASEAELARRKNLQDRQSFIEYYSKDFQEKSQFTTSMASAGQADPWQAKQYAVMATYVQERVKAGDDLDKQTRAQLKMEAELLAIERDKAMAKATSREELARLTGAVREELSAEIEVLKIQLAQAKTGEERAVIAEKISQKTARRDLDGGKLMSLGMDQYAARSFDDFADKLQNTIPDAFKASSEAAASFFEDVANGSGNIKKVLSTVKGEFVKLAAELVLSGTKTEIFSALGMGPGKTLPKPQGTDGAALLPAAIPWGFWKGQDSGQGSSTPEAGPAVPGGQKGWQANKGAIVSAAMATGVDPGLAAKISGFESGGYNANADNGNAKGLFQFIPGTWKEMLAEKGAKYDLSPSASPFDPRANALMGAEYIKKNQEAIEKALGREASDKDVYATHLLGTSGGIDFLKALRDNPGQTADSVVSSKALDSNSAVFKDHGRVKTLQESYDTFGSYLDRFQAQATEARRMASRSGSDSPYGMFGREGVQGVSSAGQSYGFTGLAFGAMGARSLLSQVPTNSGVVGYLTGQSDSVTTVDAASGGGFQPVSFGYGGGASGETASSGIGFVGSGSGTETANAMVANLVAYHGMSPTAATAYVSSLGYSPQASAAVTTQKQSSSGLSSSDLTKLSSNGLTDTVNNFGFSDLGIGSLSNASYSGLSATDSLITTASGQTIAVPASDVASTLALNEGATVTGSAADLAGTSGASVAGGLGSIAGGALAGAGIGYSLGSAIYSNGTGNVGAGIGAAGGAAAGAAIGSIIPGVGTLIGGVIGGVLGGSGGGLLSGHDTTSTNPTGQTGNTIMGVSGLGNYTTVGWEGFSQVSSGSFGSGSTKHFTEPVIADPQLAQQWNTAMTGQTAGLTGSLNQLGLGTSSLENFNFPLNFNITAQNASQAAANVATAMAQVAVQASGLATEFQNSLQPGEDYLQEVERIGTAYSATNVSARAAGTSLGTLSGSADQVTEGNWASQVGQLLGGNANVASTFQTYSQYGQSKADVLANTVSANADNAKQAIGLIGNPDVSMDNFWGKMGEAMQSPMDSATFQNWSNAASMMKTYDDSQRSSMQLMQDINNLRISELNEEMKAAQNVKVMVDGVEQSVSSAYSASDGLNNSLKSTIQGLQWNSALSPNTPQQTLSEQQAYWGQLKSTVEGEDSSSVSYSEDVGKLNAFASTYLQTARSDLGPSTQYNQIYQDVTGTLQNLQTRTQSEVDVLKDQLTAQDQLVNSAQQQIDQLTLSNNNLQIMNSQVTLLGQATVSGFTNLSDSMSQVAGVVNSLQGAYATMAVSFASSGFQGGFADGGSFVPGSMIVGENGPEFVRTSLSGSVTSNTDLAGIFDTSHLHLAMNQNTQVTAAGMNAILNELVANRQELSTVRVLLEGRAAMPARMQQ